MGILAESLNIRAKIDMQINTCNLGLESDK